MRFVIIISSALLLSACGNPLGRSMVDGGTIAPAPAPPAPPTDTPATTPAPLGGDTGMKLGAGAVRATGANLGMKAAISPTDHFAAGAHISARLSFSKTVLR